jgi:hypothetical protein
MREGGKGGREGRRVGRKEGKREEGKKGKRREGGKEGEGTVILVQLVRSKDKSWGGRRDKNWSVTFLHP